ncbi:hypothetical protein ASG50_01720 [Rhizobium sp. Leaf386]|nr:hypothetical protein ASG50_01720 [Rhizobium sp. Leaf386]
MKTMPADLIVVNAKVRSLFAPPETTAVAIAAGKIFAIGSRDIFSFKSQAISAFQSSAQHAVCKSARINGPRHGQHALRHRPQAEKARCRSIGPSGRITSSILRETEVYWEFVLWPSIEPHLALWADQLAT